MPTPLSTSLLTFHFNPVMNDQQSPPQADGEQHTTTAVNTAANEIINATNNAGIRRCLKSEALLTAPLSPRDGVAHQAYVKTYAGRAPMKWFDELSMSKHPVIAQILLYFSPGASFLSTECRHNVGHSSKTLKNNFQVEDRKTHYLRKISCTSYRCLCIGGRRFIFGQGQVGSLCNYCGMILRGRETLIEELQNNYVLGERYWPQDYSNGYWTGGCTSYDKE